MIELKRVSEIVENYELEHYPVGTPSLRDVIELRMFEMKLKQKDLAEILETSTSRISEYLNGKRDITIQIARSLPLFSGYQFGILNFRIRWHRLKANENLRTKEGY